MNLETFAPLASARPCHPIAFRLPKNRKNKGKKEIRKNRNFILKFFGKKKDEGPHKVQRAGACDRHRPATMAHRIPLRIVVLAGVLLAGIAPSAGAMVGPFHHPLYHSPALSSAATSLLAFPTHLHKGNQSVPFPPLGPRGRRPPQPIEPLTAHRTEHVRCIARGFVVYRMSGLSFGNGRAPVDDGSALKRPPASRRMRSPRYPCCWCCLGAV